MHISFLTGLVGMPADTCDTSHESILIR